MLLKTKLAQNTFLALLFAYSAANPACSTDEQCKAQETRYTAEFRRYKKELEKRFVRNMPANLSIPKDLYLKFYLLPDGFIRDARVIKTSGNKAVDMFCLDAILCSSPLPLPPKSRGPLPPPPLNSLVPPDWFGSGTYTFRFGKTIDKNKTKQVEFKYKIVPLEVLHRYPGLFAINELKAKENELSYNLSTNELEVLRYQWSQFFSRKKNPSKVEVIEKSKQIVNLKDRLLLWSRELAQ